MKQYFEFDTRNDYFSYSASNRKPLGGAIKVLNDIHLCCHNFSKTSFILDTLTQKANLIFKNFMKKSESGIFKFRWIRIIFGVEAKRNRINILYQKIENDLKKNTQKIIEKQQIETEKLIDNEEPILEDPVPSNKNKSELKIENVNIPTLSNQNLPEETVNKKNTLPEDKFSNDEPIINTSISGTELEQCGSKQKNLVKQVNLIASLNIEGVKVPLPYGISSEKVKAFLENHDAEIFNAWKSFDPILNKETADSIELIQTKISEAFSKYNKESIEILLPKDLRRWLFDCRQKGNFLMVRSSGEEDSEKGANAGGNVSKAYILPEIKPVLDAIKEVVLSYFSFTSLQNRINMGINPFNEPLKMGLTLQELIGENINEKEEVRSIPVSVVLFTNEPLYVGNENFRIMRISATYGHGNGVVGGNDLIPTDTYLVLQSEIDPEKLYILKDIQKKAVRLGPVELDGIVSLEKLRNPDHLVNKATLTDEMIKRLFQWGLFGEKLFNDKSLPTDMELVIKEGTIYPVQARPIVRPIIVPTYLDKDKIKTTENPIKQIISLETIVSGSSSVQSINSHEEILIEATLEEAERKFVKDKHKVVIVYTEEPANSHPVVNFSGLGIPCFYLKDKNILNQNLLDSIDIDLPLIICSQNALMYIWDQTILAYDQCISEGFMAHPANITLNQPQSFLVSSKEIKVPDEVKDFLQQIKAAKTHTIALNILKNLKKTNWVNELRKNKDKTIQNIRTINPVSIYTESLLENLNAIDSILDAAFKELKGALKKPEGDKLRNLFHVKVLDRVLSTIICKEFYPLIEKIEQIIPYQKELTHPAHFSEYLSLGNYLPNESKSIWQEFLISLEKEYASGEITVELIQNFKKYISTIVEAGAFPNWILLFFDWNTNDSAKNFLTKLILDENFNQLNQVACQLDNIKQWQLKTHLFSSAKTYDQIWSQLQKFSKNYHSEYLNVLYGEHLEKTSIITKVALLKVMEDFVNVFDLSIKAMKSSKEFTFQEKFKNFNAMLKLYFDLMEDWFKNIVPESIVPKKSFGSLSSYLSDAKQRLIYLAESDQEWNLQPSKNFSVAAAALSSEARFDRHLPNSLEDIFTLIHQNCLVAISLLNNHIVSNTIIYNSYLPELIKEAVKVIKVVKKEEEEFNPIRTGITINPDGDIRVRYNFPLRQHSGTIDFHYERNSKKAWMTGALLGEARERWIHSKIYLEALNYIGAFELEGPIALGKQEIIFSCKLSDKKNVECAFTEYSNLAYYSLLQGGYVNPYHLFNPLQKTCKKEGKEELFIDFILKKPEPEFKSNYNTILKNELCEDSQKTLPIAALYFSEDYKSYLGIVDKFLLEWSKQIKTPYKDFVENYKNSGLLERWNEKILIKFIPKDSDGLNIIFSRIKLAIDSLEHQFSLDNNAKKLFANYINQVDDLSPLLNLIKAKLKLDDEVLNKRRLVPLIKKLINKVKDPLQLKFFLGIEDEVDVIIFDVLSKTEVGLSLLNKEYLRLKKLGKFQFPLLSYLVKNNLNIDEAIFICLEKDLKVPEEFIKKLTLINVLVERKTKHIIEHLEKFSESDIHNICLAQVVYAYWVQFRIHNIPLNVLDSSIILNAIKQFNYKILLDENLKNKLLLELASGAIFSNDRKIMNFGTDVLIDIIRKGYIEESVKIIRKLLSSDSDILLSRYGRIKLKLRNKIVDSLLKNPSEINIRTLKFLLEFADKTSYSQIFALAGDFFKNLSIQSRDLELCKSICTKAIENNFLEFPKQFALRALKYNDIEIRKLGFSLVREFYYKYKLDEIAFEAIDILIEHEKNSNEKMIEKLLEILPPVVKKGHKLDLALRCVKEDYENKGNLYDDGLKVLTILLEKGKGYELASEIIPKLLQEKRNTDLENLICVWIRNNIPLSDNMISIVNTNFNSRFAKAYIEAETLTEQVAYFIDDVLIKKWNSSSDSDYLDLALTLVEKNFNAQKALEFAFKGQNHFYPPCRSIAYKIFAALIEKNLFHHEIKQMLPKGLLDPDEGIRKTAYELLANCNAF